MEPLDPIDVVDLFPEEIPLATRQSYRSLLVRAWRDGILTDAEKHTLDWAAGCLGLSEQVSDDLFRLAAEIVGHGHHGPICVADEDDL